LEIALKIIFLLDLTLDRSWRHDDCDRPWEAFLGNLDSITSSSTKEIIVIIVVAKHLQINVSRGGSLWPYSCILIEFVELVELWTEIRLFRWTWAIF